MEEAKQALEKKQLEEQKVDVLNQELSQQAKKQKEMGLILDQQNKQLDDTNKMAEKQNNRLKKYNSSLVRLIDMVKNSNIGLYIMIFTIEMCAAIFVWFMFCP